MKSKQEQVNNILDSIWSHPKMQKYKYDKMSEILIFGTAVVEEDELNQLIDEVLNEK